MPGQQTKSQRLDGSNVAAAATRTKPAQSLQALAVAFNELLARLDLTQSFRLLLAKLDADGGVTDTDYAQLHAPRSDADVVTQFNKVLEKLDDDAGVTPVDFESTLTATAANLPAKFTALLAKLGGDYPTTIPTTQFATLLKQIPLDSQ